MVSARAKALLLALPSGSPTEEQEQIALFELFELHRGRYPELGLAYHVPNGGKRGKAEAGRFRAMGVKSGVPDVVLPVPRRGCCGLYVEMKRANGVPSDVKVTQRQWIDALIAQGYCAVVAWGAAEAWQIINHYMHGARTITIGVDSTGNMP